MNAPLQRGNSRFDTRDSRLKSLFGNSLTTLLFRRDRLWFILLSAAAVILTVGWWANRSVESAVKANLKTHLQTLLDADVEALEIWLSSQRSAVIGLAKDERIYEPVAELTRVAQNPETKSVAADLLTSEALGRLRGRLTSWLEDHEGIGFLVTDRDLRIIAGDGDSGIGDAEMVKPFEPVLQPVFEGETVLIPPFKSIMLQPDSAGIPRAGIPVMYVCAPVKSPEGDVVALLGLRLRPEAEFSQILRVARAGASGETYAFSRKGVMLTNSRFDDELKSIGLLLDNDETFSLLNIEIRDPGVDMTSNKRPSQRRSEQPLTKMASSAVQGESGVDVDGYRDYRGVPVIGAWHWLDEYNLGVATEVDVSEAFQPLYSLRRAFGVLTGLLLLTAIANGWLAWMASRMEYKARKAAVSARRLGQYSLDEKIGEGGMGTVYRAHHDMLRRPTAVKLLNIAKTNEQSIARFEREVQLTSQLTHPNTIAIYDYGRTPEGIFYYAMEYLEGLALDELVDQFGPQPEGRVIYILKQVCMSLAEAHERQLIHRDIKPGNIMLTQRGGMGDFAKLLDFGLVKSQEAELDVTVAGGIIGTPQYLPPEAIENAELNPRSDLYSLGAVAYYLLTGEPVFDGKSFTEVCMQQINEQPKPPSERVGRAVTEDFEQIILSCLAKAPAERPQTARDLHDLLQGCSAAKNWSLQDANSWWENREQIDDVAATTETSTPHHPLDETTDHSQLPSTE